MKKNRLLCAMGEGIQAIYGNLLLSVPLRGNGSIDEKEEAILKDIASWMAVNREGVYGTRPWEVFGESPAAEAVIPLKGQGFNEGKHQPYTAQDIRFVKKDVFLYSHVMAWPKNRKVVVKSLSAGNRLAENVVDKVELLGYDHLLEYSQIDEGLIVELPETKPNLFSLILKILTIK